MFYSIIEYEISQVFCLLLVQLFFWREDINNTLSEDIQPKGIKLSMF